MVASPFNAVHFGIAFQQDNRDRVTWRAILDYAPNLYSRYRKLKGVIIRSHSALQIGRLGSTAYKVLHFMRAEAFKLRSFSTDDLYHKVRIRGAPDVGTDVETNHKDQKRENSRYRQSSIHTPTAIVDLQGPNVKNESLPVQDEPGGDRFPAQGGPGRLRLLVRD